MRKLKYIFTPFLIPHIFCYILLSDKEYIKADISAFSTICRFKKHYKTVFMLVNMLLYFPEFRNIYYLRISDVSKKFHLGFILDLILPKKKLLWIGTAKEKIGKGLFIQHGNSTIIHAKSIGDYCWINQNVSIGENGKGIPQIGNNVRICTGAVILGPITIGDNAIIGANATIVKNVPANCIVVPSPSYIIMDNGKRVYEKL